MAAKGKKGADSRRLGKMPSLAEDKTDSNFNSGMNFDIDDRSEIRESESSVDSEDRRLHQMLEERGMDRHYLMKELGLDSRKVL